MKGDRKIRRKLAEARENRNAIWRVAVTVGAGMTLLYCITRIVPIGSPRRMVEAQVVRGDRILEGTPERTNNPTPSIATNGDSTSSILTQISNAPSPSNVSLKAAIVEKDKYLPVSFAQLAGYSLEVTREMAEKPSSEATKQINEQIPGTISALNQQSVSVSGFMLPIYMKGGLTTKFLLLRNQMACCYGIAPKINEWIIVQATNKSEKPIMDVPITVEGTFHVSEQREDGRFLGIYALDCDRVISPKN
jgi:hypothetical protein